MLNFNHKLHIPIVCHLAASVFLANIFSDSRSEKYFHFHNKNCSVILFAASGLETLTQLYIFVKEFH